MYEGRLEIELDLVLFFDLTATRATSVAVDGVFFNPPLLYAPPSRLILISSNIKTIFNY